MRVGGQIAVPIVSLFLLAACNGIDVGFDGPDDVVPETVWVEEDLASPAAPAVDILFVIDGTGSMAEEQASLASASATFVSVLAELEVSWQLGATSSDLTDEGVLAGDPWIITPTVADPAAALADALLVGTDHVPPSAGLDAATLALRDSSGQNRGFRRAAAALHVVFVSDDDDQSGEVLGADPVGTFVTLLANQAAQNGLPARASAVVGGVPDGCEGATGSARAGTRYLEVVERTGGVDASVCDVDFSVVAEEIAALAVDWPVLFPLQAAPEPGSVTVTVNGERRSDWELELDPPAIRFSEAPGPDADVHVRYALEEEAS